MIAALLALPVVWTFAWRALQLRRLRSLEASSAWLEALSVAWAWGDLDAVRRALAGLGHPEATLSAPARPGLDTPVRFALVVLVALYQSMPRRRNGVRICSFYPGCSCYAVGCLRRWPLRWALGAIRLRLLACDGSRTGIDLPDWDAPG